MIRVSQSPTEPTRAQLFRRGRVRVGRNMHATQSRNQLKLNYRTPSSPGTITRTRPDASASMPPISHWRAAPSAVASGLRTRHRRASMGIRRTTLAAVGTLVISLGAANAQVSFKAVMHSDLKIVDPIWTTAYITRNHGYMIYDTLFAMDEKGEIKPQMVDRYDQSADKLTHTFTLRDGLLWHDGAPVTAEDCVASIKRWAAKDTLGQKVMSFVDTIAAQGPNTFTINLKEPTGLLVFALGKPSSN